MASTTKKDSKKSKAKPRRPVVNTLVAEQTQTIAELRQQLVESLLREEAKDKKLQERDRQLAEALEQQTATSEILGVIASSQTDIQPVLDTVIASAVKLAGATKGHIRQFDGKFHRVVAHYGESEEWVSFLRANPLSADPDTLISRAFLQRRPIHIHDVQLETGEVLA